MQGGYSCRFFMQQAQLLNTTALTRTYPANPTKWPTAYDEHAAALMHATLMMLVSTWQMLVSTRQMLVSTWQMLVSTWQMLVSTWQMLVSTWQSAHPSKSVLNNIFWLWSETADNCHHQHLTETPGNGLQHPSSNHRRHDNCLRHRSRKTVS